MGHANACLARGQGGCALVLAALLVLPVSAQQLPDAAQEVLR